MSFDEQISQIKAFGKAVAAGAKPGTISVPEFQLTPEELKNISEFVENSKDDELKIGFANSLLRILTKSLNENETKSNIDLFKPIVLDFALKETTQTTLNGILRAINHLFTESNGKWDELTNFILNEREDKFDFLRANIITSAYHIQDSDFVKENRELLLKAINDLLTSSHKEDLPISRLLLIMTLKQPTFDDIKDYCEIIWQTCIDMAQKDSVNSVCQAMHDFREIQGFSKYQAKCVDERIAHFGDANVDFEERIQSITPIIRLFPFLDDSALEKLLVTIINYANENAEEGIATVSKFDETNLDFIDDDASILISVYVQQAIENENPCAGLLLYGPLADFVQADEAFDKKVYALIEDCLNRQPSEALCALFAIQHTAMRLPASVNLFKGILQYVPYDGPIGEAAFEAIVSLYETTQYSEDVYVKVIIDDYQAFAGKTSLYAKLFIELLDKCEDPGLALAQPIYEFAIPLIAEDKSEEEKALALTLFSQIADINTDFVEDRLEDMMEAALQIVHSSNKGCVAAAANFFAPMAASFPQIVRERVLDILPELISYIKGEKEADIANRNSIATAVCDIIADYDLRDNASEVAEVATKDLNNENEDIQAEAVEMLYVLCKALLPDAAISLFETLCGMLESYTSKQTINTFIKTIKALMKKYRVNKETAKKAIQIIYEGKVPAVGSIENLDDADESAVFDILKTFTKKYKKDALPFINQVIGVLSFLDTDLIESALEPIETALKITIGEDGEKLIDKDTVEELSETLLDMLKGDDNDPAKYVCPVINGIRISYPGVIDDQELLQLLNDRLELCDDKEDLDSVNAISCLILSIASVSQCDPQLISECCHILPISPDYCDLHEVLDNVNKIVDFEGLPEETIRACLFFLSRVVLMKKSQLDEYEVPADVIGNTKQHISQIIKAKPQMKEPLTQLLLKKKLSKVQVNSLLK